MNNILKIALSILPIIILGIIPYNFFAEFSGEEFDTMFNILMGIQVFNLLGLIYIIYNLWKNPNKTTSTKWTWTLLTIFVVQPITTLIYLWAIEPDKDENVI